MRWTKVRRIRRSTICSSSSARWSRDNARRCATCLCHAHYHQIPADLYLLCLEKCLILLQKSSENSNVFGRWCRPRNGSRGESLKSCIELRPMSGMNDLFPCLYKRECSSLSVNLRHCRHIVLEADISETGQCTLCSFTYLPRLIQC